MEKKALQGFLLFFSFFLFGFRDRVSLYSPGCPGTNSVDQAGLELRDLFASASQVLELKACATTAQLGFDSYTLVIQHGKSTGLEQSFIQIVGSAL
jgi:hypothetical protein